MGSSVEVRWEASRLACMVLDVVIVVGVKFFKVLTSSMLFVFPVWTFTSCVVGWNIKFSYRLVL